MKPQPPFLEVKSLSVWYESLFGDIHALDVHRMEIAAGTITCLLGRNGSGKTTLFRTISGVLKDYDGKVIKGEIRFLQQNILSHRASEIVARGISQTPQGRHVFHTLSVEENLDLGAYVNRKQPRARRIIRDRKVEIFNLFPVLKRKQDTQAGHLSGGEQQMLAIGRALMSAPRLVLMDEPFLGLAPTVIDEILNALLRLKDRGVTLFLAEQNAAAALSVADTGLVLERGTVVKSGTAAELKTNTRVKEIFFGEFE